MIYNSAEELGKTEGQKHESLIFYTFFFIFYFTLKFRPKTKTKYGVVLDGLHECSQ